MSKSKHRGDVETLLAERVRYETWIAQLAAKAGHVPTHVADRVRADYEARLAKVVESLTGRADELRDETAELDARIQGIEAELTGKKDARA